MATFSVTDRQTFKRCRRKWDYASNARQNLEKIGVHGPALELGGLIHRALAGWMLDPKANAATIFLDETNKRVEEIKTQYKETKGFEIDEVLLDPLFDTILLGRAMLENYQAFYKKPLPDYMTFASAEQEIIVPIPGTEHQCSECLARYSSPGPTIINAISQTANTLYHDDLNGLALVAYDDCEKCKGDGYTYHYLSATLDGMLQDNNGVLYVLENKTYHPRYKPTHISLQMADQFTGYVWELVQLKIGKIGGVAYNGLCKQKAPSKTGKSTKMEDLFIRTTIRKTPEEIEEWGKNLAKEIMDMATNPKIYPNVPWNGCEGDCDFIEPCMMQLKGEDPSKLIQMNYAPRNTVRIQGIVK